MKKTTVSTKPVSIKSIQRDWHIVDLAHQKLGRVTHEIARLLQGKHKVYYTSYLDSGDYVVVVNAKKVTMSGKKSESKLYSYYSGFPGGLRITNFRTLMEKHPSEVVRHAVAGMLPKNKLRDKRLTRLFIFPDKKHPYEDRLKKS